MLYHKFYGIIKTLNLINLLIFQNHGAMVKYNRRLICNILNPINILIALRKRGALRKLSINGKSNF